ncbi:IS110 family transposase [Mycobacterium arosiense]|uniref:IS110 family transposase n=1 Tax=Mycobacterium arosiense ATCC BAA-1401 = DSM 45069 TaxID=1265311 RepID=A0A1W9ZIZ3_MYCAI|nr:IS110 family transposase [Mycobacterium arosiense]ORA16052.1 IS110 family transposase [Mycobacterium arosiense ATCC BAA-1401 = DSM 45069]
MAVAVGIDIAQEMHWVCLKITETGQLLASHKVDNTPADIAGLVDEIRAAAEQHGAATVGIDILGGIAALAEAMLLDAGITLVHVPGLAVNRARRATVDGEHKSDPKDAAVIADQVRMREDLRPVTAQRDVDVDLRLLVGRRSEIVTDQTRRAARLRDLLVSIHPGLERVVDVTGKAGLHLLTRYVTPAEIRAAGRRRLLAHLRRAGHLRETTMTALTDAAVAAAQTQRITVPGETVAAQLIRALATEMLSAREQLKMIDARIEAILAEHPDAALVRSLPGMGATLTAEFLAITGGIDRYTRGDQLAAAAGLAPVLKQSGKSRYLQRATAEDKALKRVFYQSAFIAISCDPASKSYYQRKRTEGKVHHQAVISLALRRVNVLHAMLRNRRPYNAGHSASAA